MSTPFITMSSESTFSVGERIIDSYKASLTPENVQMLVCGVDWVRALHGLKGTSDVSFNYVL
jgi:hypothetical protein